MKITPIENVLDRKIITAMVVSTRYLREVRDMYSPELLTADFARRVAQWCLDYYEKHQKAPGRHIQDIFDAAAANKKLKQEQQDLIRPFLAGLSTEYEKHGGEAGINVDYLLDETERWFQRRDLEHLNKEIAEALAKAGPEEAEDLLRQRHRIERSTVDGFNPLTDDNALDDVFETPLEPLFEFPGAMGQLVNHACIRDSMIGIMAPEKSGKTFELTEFIKRSCMGRCNTALFELGDMSAPQIKRRLFSNLCGMPSHQRWTGDTLVPMVDCWHAQLGCCPTGKHDTPPIRGEDDLAIPEAPSGYEPCPFTGRCKECRPTVCRKFTVFPKVMQRADADRARQSLARHMGQSVLRFDVKPNNTTTAEMINDTLGRWKEKLGFVPDVIGIDYDATMAREKGVKDEREGMNEQWKWFRRISTEWHCLVLVCTQTDANGLDCENLSLDNFSGDKRKYSHCTGMLGIHGTRQEFKLGLARLGWMLGREEEYGIMDQVVMTRHLRICRPLVGSFWRDKTYKPKQLVAAQGEQT